MDGDSSRKRNTSSALVARGLHFVPQPAANIDFSISSSFQGLTFLSCSFSSESCPRFLPRAISFLLFPTPKLRIVFPYSFFVLIPRLGTFSPTKRGSSLLHLFLPRGPTQTAAGSSGSSHISAAPSCTPMASGSCHSTHCTLADSSELCYQLQALTTTHLKEISDLPIPSPTGHYLCTCSICSN